MTAFFSALFMNSLIFKSRRGNSQLVLSITSVKLTDLQLALAGVGCLKLAVLCIGWGGSSGWCCFTQGRQPHRVANPSAASASCASSPC